MPDLTEQIARVRGFARGIRTCEDAHPGAYQDCHEEMLQNADAIEALCTAAEGSLEALFARADELGADHTIGLHRYADDLEDLDRDAQWEINIDDAENPLEPG